MKRAIKAVVFDLDGTLVGVKTAVHSLARTIHALGLPSVSLRRMKAQSSQRPKDAFSALFPDYTHLAGEAERLFVHYYQEHAKQGRLSLPHALYTLRFLKRAGVKIGILSSKERRLVKENVKTCRLCCDLMIAGEDLEQPKPHPSSLFVALQRLHARPAEAIYVGDTPADIFLGKRAGVTTVGVTTGLHTARELKAAGADYIISDVSEVLEIIRESGA